MLYIPMIDLFYNKKFIPLNSFHLFCPTPHHHHLFSISMSLFLLCFICLYFQIPQISEIIWYVSFLTYLTQHNTLQVHSCWCRWKDFIIFYGWIIYNCMYIQYVFIYIYQIFSLYLSTNTDVAFISLSVYLYVCVFGFEVNLLQEAHLWVLFLKNPFCHSVF